MSAEPAASMVKRRCWRESWAVFGLALVVRLATVVWAHGRIPPTADGTYYQTIAERIAAGHGYTWLWPDGVVTYAAHYPIGYPAILGAAYAAFGSSPTVAMGINAIVGALGALAVHRMLARLGPAAPVGGVLVALHPALVAYTPAVMTEGLAGSLLLLATWSATVARQQPRRAGGASFFLVLAGILLGVATLVRPQLVVLAPFLGCAAARPAWRQRLFGATLVTALALATCVPWTLRNCSRMNRCAFVSVNGGWNLLIGTNPNARGAYAAIDVPAECREVFDEAGKDRCFGAAAQRRIRENPAGWLSLVPGKLAATFDYCGAAGFYLHHANAAAFGDRAKLVLGVVETAFNRFVLIAALLVTAPTLPRRAAGRRRAARVARAIAWIGAAFALSPWGYVAHVALTVTLGVRAVGKAFEPVVTLAFATLASTLVVHGAFFGGGRYQVPVLGFLAAVAATGRFRQCARTRSIASSTSQSGSPTTLV